MRVARALSAIVALLIGIGTTSTSAGAAAAHYRYDHGYALNSLRESPGGIFTVGIATICRSGYAESVRLVTEAEDRRVYAEYGIVHRSSGQYEVDHVIPLELGGNNAIKNLWPEPNDHPLGYLNSKDKLENRLHALVCAHHVALAVAQRAIANDWVAAYHRYLGTWPSASVVKPPSTNPGTTSPVTTPPTKTVPRITGTAKVAITALPTTIAPGSMASLTAHSSRAHDVCRLTVQLPSGRFSESAGLGVATANAQGLATWTWRIGGNTGGGTATAIVVCGAGRAQRTFKIL